MIVEPKIRGFICTTAHPVGCAKHVQDQIDYVKSQTPVKDGPKKVLVIGSSTGYGLSSRIVASFGCEGAQTMGVFFEKPSDGRKPATAGWYNSVAFEEKAKEAGIYAKSFNGDAFSDEMKDQVAQAIKEDWGQVDLVIYSLASPRRQHPKTGEVARSVLKPLSETFTDKSINLNTNQIEEVSLEPASQEEIDQTVSVMGGEDWEMWIEKLQSEGLLADGALTVAYSYMGPEVTHKVYRNGTIGQAKSHLEATAKTVTDKLKDLNGQGFVSVNKALVTQSSSAIPFIPLYFIILSKIMKEKDIDEGCIEQIYRLFADRIYAGGDIPVDSSGLIRVDELELRDDVQEIVNERWAQLTNDNLNDLTDLTGYHADFLRLFGFGLDGVDYGADVEIDLKVPSIQ